MRFSGFSGSYSGSFSLPLLAFLSMDLGGALGGGLVVMVAVVEGAGFPDFDPTSGSESTCFRLADLLGLGALLGGIITANEASYNVDLRSQ